MKDNIKKLLSESLVYEVIESMIGEDYPSSFNMEEFKSLTSFNARIKYCQENLQRISSGSGRIVYKIDDEKVLKLAKNKKGVAQNEIEISHSQYHDIEDVVAQVFDYHPQDLWSEMELARKVRLNDFKRITGFSFEDYSSVLLSYSDRDKPRPTYPKVDPELSDAMWDDEFVSGILDYVGNYDLPVGDLVRLNSYGIVQRNGEDTIVIIDYGLDKNTYTSYYS